MNLIIPQELAQQVLNAIAKQPYQDVFQLVPKLLQLQILPETAPPLAVETAPSEATEVNAAAEAASTQVAQEIAASN